MTTEERQRRARALRVLQEYHLREQAVHPIVGQVSPKLALEMVLQGPEMWGGATYAALKQRAGSKSLAESLFEIWGEL
ncbi:MAG: hypothetical protein KJN71_09370 [Acidimicrobiia bacterium]|nr:hypothetical protein [Acidimicrobiia bacterium]